MTIPLKEIKILKIYEVRKSKHGGLIRILNRVLTATEKGFINHWDLEAERRIEGTTEQYVLSYERVQGFFRNNFAPIKFYSFQNGILEADFY